MIGTIAMVNNLLDNRPVMECGRRIVNPKFTGLGLYTHCSGSMLWFLRGKPVVMEGPYNIIIRVSLWHSHAGVSQYDH